MKEFIEKLIGRLEEISVSRDNDGVINGCNMGICEDDDCLKCLKKKVISIVNELAEEYKNGHFGCNSNGEHEKCRNCELDCKQRNQIWFGIKEECINTSTDTSSGWVACSERLPEEGVDVLVWFEYYRYGSYNRLYQTTGISFTYNGEWSGFVNGSSGWSQLSIIAWQPLPAPYKEGE